MVNLLNIKSIILGLIYKISFVKSEEDLVRLIIPAIVKELICSDGTILNFKHFEEIVRNSKNVENKSEKFDFKKQFIESYVKNPFDIQVLAHSEQYFYAFRLSKYGLLILNRNDAFEEKLLNEIGDFSHYFGKVLLQSITDFELLENEKVIKQQLRLQDLLISISTEYINADLSDIDELIMKSLKQLGQFVEADRSYIFSYDFENNSTSNTYEWCGEGIEPEKANLQNISINYITQWLDAHKKGKAFYVEDVSTLPHDGDFGLRDILEPQGIKSLIAIPKLKNNELIGFVGFDSVKKIYKYSEKEKNILFVFANMLVNIKQRKENEERIKEQEKKKEELLSSLALNNQELNEYAHVVSHDLKAPLRNVDTLINWMIQDNNKTFDDKSISSLHQVLFNIEKMDLLIKGILDYSTIDKLESEERIVDFNQLVDEIKTTLHIPSTIEIIVNNDLPKIQGNTWRFKQVFQNLIQNAINYNDKEKGIIEIGVAESENQFEFYVKDNGIGIAKTYHDRIFKIFTKLESSGQSSGIGLSIVKKIIHFYKGNIWLQSEENIGTTFFFTIPKQNGTT